MRHHELTGIPYRLHCLVLSASELLNDAETLAADSRFPPLIQHRIKNATTLLHTCQALIAHQHGRTQNGENKCPGFS